VPTADESNHSAAGRLHPHRSVMHMRLISYTAFSDSHPDKTFAPSLTGDINAQSSHWNSGKMKSAYDSAYVQIETLNFTFAQQAFTVSLF